MSELLPVNPTAFPSVTPEAVGITSASVLNLLDTLERERIGMHSLMILRHGKAAVQMWWQPYAPELPHQLYSFSKSVTATALGFALDEGMIALDERVAGFFRRRIDENADERIYSLTVEHLLTMTSGAFFQNEAGMRSQVDWMRWFLNTPLRCAPGEKFIYNSLNTYMLSAILRTVTGQGLVDYLMPRLFEPLGIKRPQWDRCPMGIECGGWGLSLTTEDMAKLSQLYLDKGVWQGRQVLPEGWAQLAAAKHTDSKTDAKMTGSPHRAAGYGYQLWRGCDGVSFRMDGMFGQYGIVLPEKDMVIVTTAGHADQMQLLDVLWETFIPHIDAIPHDSTPGADYDELCRRQTGAHLPQPVTKRRCRAREREANGRIYEFPGNVLSMLPLSICYLYRIHALGIDAVRFDFGDDVSLLSWREDAGIKRIPFRTDGGFCDCSLSYGGREFPAVTSAAWTDTDVLEIDIRLLHTAHMHRAIFRFSDGELDYTFDEDPPLADSIKMLIDMFRPARAIASRLSKVTNRVIPTIHAKALSKELKQ